MKENTNQIYFSANILRVTFPIFKIRRYILALQNEKNVFLSCRELNKMLEIIFKLYIAPYTSSALRYELLIFLH